MRKPLQTHSHSNNTLSLSVTPATPLKRYSASCNGDYDLFPTQASSSHSYEMTLCRLTIVTSAVSLPIIHNSNYKQGCLWLSPGKTV